MKRKKLMKPSFIVVACFALAFVTPSFASISIDAGIYPNIGTGEVWVGAITYSNDPMGDYNNGNGILDLWVQIDYDGPSFWGASGWYVASLPFQSGVQVSAINGCEEGFYSVGGDHSVYVFQTGFVDVGDSFDATYVNEYECSWNW